MSRGRSIQAGRGFTLIELGAVLVLFALAASAAVPMLGPTSDEARLRDSVSAVLDLDARARLAARGQGPLVLRPSPSDPSRIEAVHSDDEQAESGADPVISCALATGVSVRWKLGGEIVDRLAFDGTGRTQPYTVTISNAHRAMTYVVSGRTGWTQREEHGP